MDLEISYINVLKYSTSIYSKYSINWYHNDYAFVCVLILSNITNITGGYTLLRKGPGGGDLVYNPLEMVSPIETQSLSKTNRYGKGSAYIL